MAEFSIDNLVQVQRLPTAKSPRIDLYCRPLSLDDCDSDLMQFSSIHNLNWQQVHDLNPASLRKRITKWVVLGGYALDSDTGILEPAILLHIVPQMTNGALGHLGETLSREKKAQAYVRALPQAYDVLTDLASTPIIEKANAVYFLDLTANPKFAGRGLARNMIEYAKGLLLHGLYGDHNLFFDRLRLVEFAGTFSPKPNDYDSKTDPFKYDIVRLHVLQKAFVTGDVLSNARPNHPTPDVLTHCYLVPGYKAPLKEEFYHNITNGRAG